MILRLQILKTKYQALLTLWKRIIFTQRIEKLKNKQTNVSNFHEQKTIRYGNLSLICFFLERKCFLNLEGSQDYRIFLLSYESFLTLSPKSDRVVIRLIYKKIKPCYISLTSKLLYPNDTKTAVKLKNSILGQ